ncbi:MAG: Uma2 family endonuclease [Sulfuritalea sp.]|nr:Uma2 family endonuclease [Sulfuritalea sp.]
MPPLPAFTRTVSVEEYLAGELQTEIRHEYIDGQVYAMGGASDRHGLILNALAFALTPPARKRPCQLFSSDMKLKLSISGRPVFYYPDLMLACDPDDREPYFRTRPCLIVEVLSESTERIDRREKLLAYPTLPSLHEYALVAQDVRRVEIFRRANDWLGEQVIEGEVRLDCLAASIPIDAIYADLETG